MKNTKFKFLAIAIIIVFHCFTWAQEKQKNKLELSPSIGFSNATGDFDDLYNTGFSAGLTLDKFITSRFALGINLNYQSLSSINQSSIINSLGESNTNSLGFGNASIFTVGLGPMLRVGQKKFSIDLYSRAGISFVSVPDSNLQLAEADNPIDVFKIEDQGLTSFSLLSGIKFNYKVNKKLSVFLNPQYLFTGQQIEVFQREINEPLDPQFVLEDAGKLCYVRPTSLNINAGITLAIGNKNIKPDNGSRNLPIVDFGYQPYCSNGRATIDLGTNWAMAQSNDILVMSASGPYAGSITFSPNNITLGASSNSGGRTDILTFPTAASGSTIIIKAEIKDASGTMVKASKSISITLPVCKPDPKPCDLEVDIRPCEYNSSEVGLSLTANWTNIPANATVSMSLFDNSNTQINPTPISISGNPYTIPSTGSGSYTFNPRIDVGAYEGTTIKAKMEICFVGPNGQNRCCEKEIDIEVPTCCYDCEGVSITDVTPPNQKGDGFFKLLWNLAPITGASIERMTVRLESFGADDLNSTVLPQPNFEISGAGFFPTPTSGYTSKPIGSLSGKRSNFWVIDFNSPITSGNFISIIDVYDRKVLRNYRLKIVLFNTDGKRCTQYLTFNN